MPNALLLIGIMTIWLGQFLGLNAITTKFNLRAKMTMLRISRSNKASFKLLLLTLMVGMMSIGNAFAEQIPILESLIGKAISQHPSVLVEKATKESTEIDIDVARKQRYPKVDLQSNVAGYTSDNSGNGGNGLNNGLNTVLSVEQPLWTFGKLEAGIESATATNEAQDARITEVKYDLALRVVDAWQELVFATERMQELEVTLNKLNEYLRLMERRVDSRVSPEIELVLISARTSQTSDDLQQAKATRGVALSKLERLTGDDRSALEMSKVMNLTDLYAINRVQLNKDVLSDLDNSLNRHPSVLKASQQAEALSQQLIAKRAARFPEIYARAQSTFNADSNSTNNQGLFLGVRYQPGNGFSTNDIARSAESRVTSQQQVIEVVKRDISNLIGVDYENMINAITRVETLQRAKDSSYEVFASYERQFAAGRRTWQDVLNAVRENSDNRVALANARATALAAAYRIRVRMSDLEWQNP